MFCPKCKAEYRPGYTVCADCGVPLVDQLPSEEEKSADKEFLPPSADFVHILDTFDPGVTALIESVLNAERISYRFDGKYSAQYTYYTIPFRLMVPSQEADKAREVLKGLDLRRGQATLDDPRFDEDQEDQGTAEAAETIRRDIGSPKHPATLSIKWILVGLFLVTACAIYFHWSSNDSEADLYVKAGKSFAKGNFGKARSYYEKAIKLDPKSDNLRYLVGRTYEDQGDFKKALRLYDEAIELNPKNSDAYQRRAYIYSKLKEYDRALQEIDKAINLSPADATTYAGRGIIYSHLRDYQQAISSFDRAIDLSPDYAIAYASRGWSKDQLGKRDEAVEDYNKVLDLKPNGPWDYLYRGIARDGLGKYSDAVADFDRVLSSYPGDGYAYLWRGWSYFSLEDYARATADFGKAIDLDPRRSDAYLSRAKAYEASGKCSNALKDCNKAIELAPDEPAGYASMAWILATCGEQKYRDGQRALGYAQEGLAREEKAKGARLAEDYDALAAAYAEIGDFDQAAQTESKAYGLYRLPDARIKSKDDAKELMKAYKNRQTYVEWKSKSKK